MRKKVLKLKNYSTKQNSENFSDESFISDIDKQISEKYNKLIKKIENIAFHNIEGDERNLVLDILEVIRDFQTDLRESKVEMTALKKDIEHILHEKDKFCSSTSEIEKKIEDVRKDVDELIYKLEQITSNFESHKDRVANIENDITEMKDTVKENHKTVSSIKTVLIDWTLKTIITTIVAAIALFILAHFGVIGK